MQWACEKIEALSGTLYDREEERRAGGLSAPPPPHPTSPSPSTAPASVPAIAEAPEGPKLEFIGESSFLSLFLQAHNRETGSKLSKAEVSANAFLLILAGYETTVSRPPPIPSPPAPLPLTVINRFFIILQATTLALTVYLLSKNKDKEAKLVAEIDRLKGAQMPGPDELKGYAYVEAVVKEALRLYGPATFAERKAGTTTAIGPGGKYEIHRGVEVHCDIRTMNRDAAYFTDPEAFIPERFMPTQHPDLAARQHLKAFNPFGFGPRVCVAYKFAMQEAILALITLYSRFSFTLKEGYELNTKLGITMTPEGGVPVIVHSRAMFLK